MMMGRVVAARRTKEKKEAEGKRRFNIQIQSGPPKNRSRPLLG